MCESPQHNACAQTTRRARALSPSSASTAVAHRSSRNRENTTNPQDGPPTRRLRRSLYPRESAATEKKRTFTEPSSSSSSPSPSPSLLLLPSPSSSPLPLPSPSSPLQKAGCGQRAWRNPNNAKGPAALPLDQAHDYLHIPDQQTRLHYPGEPLSGHVATRWYRAPEVLLRFYDGYGPEMDMWAVGCILAELLLGRPLFPGKNTADQLLRISQVLGKPPPDVLTRSPSTSAPSRIASWRTCARVDWPKLFTGCDPLAADLVSKLLQWDPSARCTAQEALSHPWLAAYKSSTDKWTPPTPFAAFEVAEFTHRVPDWIHGFQAQEMALRGEWSSFSQLHALSTVHLPLIAQHEQAEEQSDSLDSSHLLDDELALSPSSSAPTNMTGITTPSDDPHGCPCQPHGQVAGAQPHTQQEYTAPCSPHHPDSVFTKHHRHGARGSVREKCLPSSVPAHGLEVLPAISETDALDVWDASL